MSSSSVLSCEVGCDDEDRLSQTRKVCSQHAASAVDVHSIIDWTDHLREITVKDQSPLEPFIELQHSKAAIEFQVDFTVTLNMLFKENGVFSKKYEYFSFDYGFNDDSDSVRKAQLRKDVRENRRLFTCGQLEAGIVRTPYGKPNIDMKNLDWILTLGVMIQKACNLQFYFDEVHLFDQFSFSTSRFDWHTDYVNNVSQIKTTDYRQRKTTTILIWIDDVSDLLCPYFNGIEILGHGPQIYTKVGDAMLFDSGAIHRSINFSPYSKNKIVAGALRPRLIKATYFFPG